MPFTNQLWLAVILSLLISSLILFVIDYFTSKLDKRDSFLLEIYQRSPNNLCHKLKKYQNTFTDVYALFVQQPVVHAS